MRMQSTRLRAMSHVKVGAIEHVVRHVGDTSARACLCVSQRLLRIFCSSVIITVLPQVEAEFVIH